MPSGQKLYMPTAVGTSLPSRWNVSILALPSDSLFPLNMLINSAPLVPNTQCSSDYACFLSLPKSLGNVPNCFPFGPNSFAFSSRFCLQRKLFWILKRPSTLPSPIAYSLGNDFLTLCSCWVGSASRIQLLHSDVRWFCKRLLPYWTGREKG